MSPRLWIAALVAAALLVTAANGQCAQYVTCEACISALPGNCVWCSDDNGADSSVNSVRCFERYQNASCQNLEDPSSTLQELPTDDELVRPRILNVTLRPGQEVSVNITVRTARNFPLDLYLLIDTSASLSDDVMTLRSLSFNITQSLANISSNYKIGFGTFTDKPLLPYTPIADFRSDSGTCNSGLNECVNPYSYRHVLSLTNDEDEFTEVLARTGNSSFSVDSPESGFDAIVQAVVCQSEIGWRDRATKIIVYMSDAISHVAGDGKLATIVKPSDGLCHLSVPEGGSFLEYDSYATFDYVSLGLLEEKLRSFDTNVIFAIGRESGSDDAFTYYDAVRNDSRSNRMFLSRLGESSDNIIEVIETQYEILLGSILLEPVPIEGVTVEVNPIDCPTPMGNECSDVLVEQTVVFNVTIKATRCVDGSFEIRVRGFNSIQVNVQSECRCDCARNAVMNSPDCRNGTGTRVCGVCVCSEEMFDCPTADSSSVQCSGNGRCTSCGECICNRRDDANYYYGPDCECDTFSCGTDSQGRVCGGNGNCCNGGCVCSSLFTGSLCDCTTNETACISEGSSRICSDVGTCMCGECRCSAGYTGRFCESCTAQSCSPCNLYSNCVQCHLNLIDNNCGSCNSQVNIVTQDDGSFENATECNQVLSGCGVEYFVRQDRINGSYFILVTTNAESCPDSSGTSGLIGGVPWWVILVAILVPILIIILGIIILIIIKICVMIKDRRELKSFQSEVQDPTWEDVSNPLYVTPVTEYANVAYKKKKTTE